MKGMVKQMVESFDESDPDVIAAREEWQLLDRALQSKYVTSTPIGSRGLTMMPGETLRQMEEDRDKVEKAKERYYELKKGLLDR